MSQRISVSQRHAAPIQDNPQAIRMYSKNDSNDSNNNSILNNIYTLTDPGEEGGEDHDGKRFRHEEARHSLVLDIAVEVSESEVDQHRGHPHRDRTPVNILPTFPDLTQSSNRYTRRRIKIESHWYIVLILDVKRVEGRGEGISR